MTPSFPAGAIELNPTSPMVYYNLGVVHLDLCEIDQAIACFRQAVEVKPTAPLPHWGLALALLVDGRYMDGWREYEWRWECTDFFAPRPNFTQPAWDGSDPTGKRILVYAEQGLGDAIQFALCICSIATRSRCDRTVRAIDEAAICDTAGSAGDSL